MPDYNRLVKMNPALLANRIVAAEEAIARQLALNDAAAKRILEHEETIAQQGAYIVALLEKCGGRLELTPADLHRLQTGNLRAHYRYPDKDDPNFVIVLAADGAQDRAAVADEIETRLRAAGYSDEQIAAFRRTAEALDAGPGLPEVEPYVPLAGDSEVVGPQPGDVFVGAKIVGPDGEPTS